MNRRQGWLLTIGAMLTMSVSYFDRQSFSALSPTVTRELAISDDQYGLLVSAFSVAYLVGSPIAGRIVDRFGARRTLLLFVFLWSMVSGLHALAGSFLSLCLLRVALGLAESPGFPGAAQTITRALPPEKQARGFGILFTGSSLGALVAPLVAGALEERFNWNVAFLGSAAAGLLWIPMWLAMTSSKEVAAALDAKEPAAAKLGSETLGTEREGIVTTLLRRNVLRAMVVIAASASLAGFVLNWGPKFLTLSFGLEQAELPRYLWAPPLLFDLGAVIFGTLASRYADHAAKTRALFWIAALLSSLLALMAFARSPWHAMIAAGLSLAGVAGLFAMTTADLMRRVPKSVESTSAGLSASTQSLVYIVSSPLIGLAVTRTGSYALPIAVLSAVVLPGVWLFLSWKPEPVSGDRHEAAALRG